MSGSGKKQQKKMSYRDRQAVTYEQGPDPPFLAQMKKQLGYREYTVEDKFNHEDEQEEDDTNEMDRDDIRNMPEEERPQIVVMNPERDISSEELQKEIEKKREEEDKQKIMEGRITFRKPEKRPNVEEEIATNNKGKEKKQRSGEMGQGDEKKKEPAKEPTQNRRLLSFGDEEEDD